MANLTGVTNFSQYNFPLSPTIPSMDAVLSGSFLRRQTPAEQVDDILGILRTGDGNWSGGSLVRSATSALSDPAERAVDDGLGAFRRLFAAADRGEIGDNIVGVLRPGEGNWTGPAASLWGIGPARWASTRAAWRLQRTGQPVEAVPTLAADAVDRRSEPTVHRPDHHPARRQRLAANAADRRSEETLHRPDHRFVRQRIASDAVHHRPEPTVPGPNR